jgi:hypothetical protein
MRRLLALLATVTALGAVALAGYYVAVVRPRVPSNDRAWTPPHARLPRTEFRGDTVIVHDFRRFRYSGRDRYTAGWTTDTFHLSRLRSVMFALSPFGAEWTGSAHSFVTFAFTDSQFVSISAEGRRQVGQDFGLWAGLTRRMGLIYVVGDENDVVRRRVIDGDHIYLYPVNSPPRRTREMFVSMLRSANALRDRPEFYNLVDNNCTSVLVEHVNQLIPGRIPRGWQTLLPGYADRVAQRIDLIPVGGSNEALRRRYRINDIAAGLADDALFSVKLHEALGDAPIAGTPVDSAARATSATGATASRR